MQLEDDTASLMSKVQGNMTRLDRSTSKLRQMSNEIREMINESITCNNTTETADVPSNDDDCCISLRSQLLEKTLKIYRLEAELKDARLKAKTTENMFEILVKELKMGKTQNVGGENENHEQVPKTTSYNSSDNSLVIIEEEDMVKKVATKEIGHEIMRFKGKKVQRGGKNVTHT